ncbi:MAG: lipocalin-like domain-containing protein [Anaerolineae bacterium]|nr:lipocalin-like domain-containing protein [Anaerolineae bacterium]
MNEADQQTARAPFVGTWHLVSQHSHFPDGRIEPSRGEGAIGVLMYDADGNVSVQLMRTDARAAEFTDLRTVETAFEGYLGYFGTYEVDQVAGVVNHRVLGASYPAFRGTIQRRQFRFESNGNSLILEAAIPADKTIRVLVWRKNLTPNPSAASG